MIGTQKPSAQVGGVRGGLRTVPGGNYAEFARGVAPANVIGYWPHRELTGTVSNDLSGAGRNGSYSGVTLNPVPVMPFLDGYPAPKWDGSGDVNTISGDALTSLAGAFNGAEGSLAIWLKVSAASVWTDGVIRGLIEVTLDANNQIYLRKISTNNSLQVLYRAGGTSKAVTTTISVTSWIHFVLTWSKSADQVKAYVNGAQSGATQTGLGTWSGTITGFHIGAVNGSGANCTDGYLAHAEAWNAAISAEQVARLHRFLA